MSVDSYTDQDWRKLEAAVDALKSPVFRDDIELDPSAIGQFLHIDYVHSLSTSNIHDIQLDTRSETDLLLCSPPASVPHSSTMHSFPADAPAGPPVAATDRMPRKARVPSMRSVKRQHIVAMAEAGDRPSMGYASSHTTRASSAVSSVQGSPVLSKRNFSVDMSVALPHKRMSSASKTSFEEVSTRKKKKADISLSTGNTSAVRLAKNLNQEVIVHENGKYRKIRLGYIHAV